MDIKLNFNVPPKNVNAVLLGTVFKGYRKYADVEAIIVEAYIKGRPEIGLVVPVEYMRKLLGGKVSREGFAKHVTPIDIRGDFSELADDLLAFYIFAQYINRNGIDLTINAYYAGDRKNLNTNLLGALFASIQDCPWVKRITINLKNLNKTISVNSRGFLNMLNGKLSEAEFKKRVSLTASKSTPGESRPSPVTAYLGCFKDQGDPVGLSGRDLNGFILQSDRMSPQMCIKICKDRGFRYAAVQYGKFCFCGNSYGRYGKADNCNMVCAGNPTKICGGTWANSVYEVGSGRGNTEATQPKSSIKSDKSGFYLDHCRAYQNAHNYASNTVPAHLSRFKRAIHMTCRIHNPQENTVITAKWYYRRPSGQLLFINQYSVRVKDTGKKYLSYHIELPKGKNWPAGNYEVHLIKEGKPIKRVIFSVR